MVANQTNTDRIEKKVLLRATRARVWRALTDAKEFGAWFKVDMQGEFKAGAPALGKITHPGYEHLTMEVHVDRIEPQRYFSFRWHPYAVDPKVDYAKEPMTLVEFKLDGGDGEILLTIVESGFDQIPLARRAEAFRMNDGGWAQQAKNIEEHVARA
jgi:uncharacterized protein YndB with AHSA1/START domain